MWTPVVVGTIATVVAIPVYVALQRASGLVGVALASVISLGLYTAALGWRWYTTTDVHGAPTLVAESAARAVPLTVIGGGVAFVAAWGIPKLLGGGFFPALLGTIIGAVAFGGAALGLGGALYGWLGRESPVASRQPPAGGK
jgi:peptidoglycan biosynthesis protein MviN/MurJ (putative lipid II flippase)